MGSSVFFYNPRKMSLLHCLSLVVVLSACASADDGWVNVGGRYLKFYATPMSFADAKSTCAKEGGIIAFDDHPLVNKHIAASAKLQWIGATDAGHEGKWTWTNGAAVRKSESHWSPGEPNNCCGGQNCAVINFKKPGIWDDQACATKLPFHCQVHKPGFAYGVAGSVLKLHKEKKTWDEAVKACRAEGAQLVIVDNKSINDWLAKIDMKLGVIWIGATDDGHEGTYNWANGKTVPKDFWSKGEPNNCCGGQDCAVVNFRAPGKWDDQSCATKLPFVCQITF